MWSQPGDGQMAGGTGSLSGDSWSWQSPAEVTVSPPPPALDEWLSGGLSPVEGTSVGSCGPGASVSPTRPPGGGTWASACWQFPCWPPGLAGTRLVVREAVTRSGHRKVGSSALVTAGQPRPGLWSSRQSFCPRIPCPWEVRAVGAWEPPDEAGDPLGRVLPPAPILSTTDGWEAGGQGGGTGVCAINMERNVVISRDSGAGRNSTLFGNSSETQPPGGFGVPAVCDKVLWAQTQRPSAAVPGHTLGSEPGGAAQAGLPALEGEGLQQGSSPAKSFLRSQGMEAHRPPLWTGGPPGGG